MSQIMSSPFNAALQAAMLIEARQATCLESQLAGDHPKTEVAHFLVNFFGQLRYE